MNQIEPQLFFQTANYTAIVACGSCPDLFSCQHYQVLDFYLTNQRTGKRVGRRYGCFRCPVDFDAVTRLVEHLFTVHFVACRLLCRYCWPPPPLSSSFSVSGRSPRAPHQLFESISQLACHFRYNHQEPQWDTDWVALWVEERRQQKSVILSAPFVELLQPEKHNNGNNKICNQMMTWESRKSCYCCCCCSSSSSRSSGSAF